MTSHFTRTAAMSVLLASAWLAGCASSSPDVISRQQAQRAQTVQRGVVESIRAVTIEGNQSGVGAATGAVVGGIAGAGAGGNRTGAVVGVLGAVIGGVAGNAIEKVTTSEKAVELILRMDDGRRIAVVQGDGAQGLTVGDTINLIGNPGAYRVVRDAGR